MRRNSISSISTTTHVLLYHKTQVGIFYFDSNTLVKKVIYYENTRGFKWRSWRRNGLSVLSQNNTRWRHFFVHIGVCPICVRIWFKIWLWRHPLFFSYIISWNVQINAYRPKSYDRIDFWTVSKNIGQLANTFTTQTVVV